MLGLGRAMAFASTAFGVALAVFSLSRSLWLSLLLLPIVGAGMMITMAATNTIIQTIVSEELRGRVMAFYTNGVPRDGADRQPHRGARGGPHRGATHDHARRPLVHRGRCVVHALAAATARARASDPRRARHRGRFARSMARPNPSESVSVVAAPAGRSAHRLLRMRTHEHMRAARTEWNIASQEEPHGYAKNFDIA